jgi:hypothetical protein
VLHAGDDVTPSVTPAPRPSHHSGPGYVANAKARDFEIHGVHDSETGGSSDSPVDVALLPDKSRVELGVDPDRRWHLEGPSPGGGDSDSLFTCARR